MTSQEIEPIGGDGNSDILLTDALALQGLLDFFSANEEEIQNRVFFWPQGQTQPAVETFSLLRFGYMPTQVQLKEFFERTHISSSVNILPGKGNMVDITTFNK